MEDIVRHSDAHLSSAEHVHTDLTGTQKLITDNKQENRITFKVIPMVTFGSSHTELW